MRAANLIRQAAEELESEIRSLTVATRRHAELSLAWHHLIDAHTLLIKGQLSPDDLVWAAGAAKSIAKDQP